MQYYLAKPDKQRWIINNIEDTPYPSDVCDIVQLALSIQFVASKLVFPTLVLMHAIDVSSERKHPIVKLE